MFWIIKRILKYLLYFIAGATVLTTGLAAYLAWFQPAFHFPKPTGQYAVGTKTYHWIDTNRKETLNDDTAHPSRELMVSIWHPSSLGYDVTGPTDGKLPDKPTTPYAPDLVDYFKKNQKLIWLLGFSRQMYSYAQPGLTMATDVPQFPVIIFSHGFGCTRDSNTAHCEELASHGYVVVGISHTYDSAIVEFPNSRIANGLKSMEERFVKIEKFMEMEKQLDQGIEIWISDVQFVLDQLEQLTNNKKSIFYQRFDQKNIGIFGHSFGGATAIQICRNDSRVKAGVNLDGAVYGTDITKKVDKPCMFMLNEDLAKLDERPWTPDDWKKFKISSQEEETMLRSRMLPAFKKIAKSIGPDGYTFVIKDSRHMDFCDSAFTGKYASLVSRILITLGASETLCLGAIDGFKMTEIVSAYLVNFFNKYLKNQPSELLDRKGKRYAEIETKQ